MPWDPDEALPEDATPAERLAAHTIATLQSTTEQSRRTETVLLHVEELLRVVSERPTVAGAMLYALRCAGQAARTQQGAIVTTAVAQALAWAIAASVAYSAGMLHLPPPSMP